MSTKPYRKNKHSYPDWLVGYVGFNLSFAAKFFGGYCRDGAGVRNYENEARKNLCAQQFICWLNFCNGYNNLYQNSVILRPPEHGCFDIQRSGIGVGLRRLRAILFLYLYNAEFE